MNMSWHRRMSGMALATIVAVVPVFAQPDPPQPAGPPMRIVLAEDLDCEAAAVAFESALREAVSQRSSIVVIDLQSNDARLDLVNRLAVAIRDAGLPTAAWVGGGDKHICPGMLALAMFTERVIVREQIFVSGSPRSDLELFAEATTSWSVHAGELRDRLAVRLLNRSDHDAVAAMLTGEVPVAYLVSDTPHDRFHTAEPPPNGARAVSQGPPTRLRLSLGSKELKSSGLVEAVARDWNAASRLLGIGRRVEERRIDVSAWRTNSTVASTIYNIERDIGLTKAVLDLPDSSTKRVAPSRYREAGQGALRTLSDASNALAKIEADLLAIPEVMRLPAPGQSPLEKPSTHAAKWRSIIRELRSDLADLERKAKDFASR